MGVVRLRQSEMFLIRPAEKAGQEGNGIIARRLEGDTGRKADEDTKEREGEADKKADRDAEKMEDEADQKGAKTVEGERERCLTCGQHKRKVYLLYGHIF